MEWVKVVKPGLLTTVQDLGRRASQTLGISASGAMDALSLRLANILVGNDEGEAALEATLLGPVLKFNADGAIAITGGNLSPSINGIPVPMWKCLAVRQDDELRFGPCAWGSRTYISFAGGIAVPTVLGSRSTFIRGRYGGIEGRALKGGDDIPLGDSLFQLKKGIVGRRLRPDHIPGYQTDRPIRFIPGPQADAFAPESLERFASGTYRVTSESDRMGYRLEGEPLRHISGADIISDFIAVGSIQVPAAGQPIILMADCQMTGGYTKLGVISSIDLPFVAQKKPGDRIHFQPADILDVQEEWIKQEQLIAELRLHNRMLPRKG